MTFSPMVFLLAVSIACRAEIIDRIAVVVGNGVITESQIVREIRLTAFQNGEPLDFSAASKRKMAERLVDQRLIQIENDISLYPPPPAGALDQALAEEKARSSSPAKFQEEMKRTGIDEKELMARLQRQLTILRFLDFRFRPGIQISDEEIGVEFEKRLPELRKAHPGAVISINDYRTEIEDALIAERVDKASEVWLKQAREHTRVEFKTSVFAPDPAPQEKAK